MSVGGATCVGFAAYGVLFTAGLRTEGGAELVKERPRRASGVLFLGLDNSRLLSRDLLTLPPVWHRRLQTFFCDRASEDSRDLPRTGPFLTVLINGLVSSACTAFKIVFFQLYSSLRDCSTYARRHV